jgi:hypothetical protein
MTTTGDVNKVRITRNVAFSGANSFNSNPLMLAIRTAQHKCSNNPWLLCLQCKGMPLVASESNVRNERGVQASIVQAPL